MTPAAGALKLSVRLRLVPGLIARLGLIQSPTLMVKGDVTPPALLQITVEAIFTLTRRRVSVWSSQVIVNARSECVNGVGGFCGLVKPNWTSPGKKPNGEPAPFTQTKATAPPGVTCTFCPVGLMNAVIVLVPTLSDWTMNVCT